MDLELESWELALRAERRAPGTVRNYLRAARSFEQSGAEVSRAGVRRWMVSGLDGGLSAKTVQLRLTALKMWARWAADEGLLERSVDEAIGQIRPPRADVPVTVPYSDDELKRILRQCGGDFAGVRDRAILLLMIETGMRAGEVCALTVADVDAKRGIAVVQRSKTGKGRVVPFSSQCGRALDRYMRIRRTSSRAGESVLFLGARGGKFSYSGLYASLRMRAEAAGVDGFHPHRLRHTAAHRWLAAGGSENGLRVVAGWTPGSAMLARYAAGAATERAVVEAAGLDLGL